MRILVFGASGQTGRELVSQTLAGEHLVTAFVRTPAALGRPVHNLQVLQGNVADRAGVGAAVAGHDAVVSTLGVGTPLRHDPDVIAGVRNIIAAMHEHRVRRLIYMSFIGVHASRASVGFLLRFVAPIPLRHEIGDHEIKEALVSTSSLDWTIVRPPTLTNGPRTGHYRSGTDIVTRAPLPRLARADVAHFILRELTEPLYIRQAPRLLP